MQDSPDPRTWLITGCSSGFGRALAERVLAAGHRAIVTARDPASIASLADLFPDTCRVEALDVCDTAAVQRVVTVAASIFGALDVVVNNAGRGLVGALEELGDEQIAENFRVNFFGALTVIRAALPHLRAQRRGRIVNISAAAAIANYAGFSIYGAAKCALEGASEALAAELKPLGIHVTLVEPGPFRTDFIARSLERAPVQLEDYAPTSGKFQKLLDSMSGRQPGDPARAAEAIMAAVLAPEPPLRLVLGRYAIDKVKRTAAARLAELAKWEEVGAATDFVRR